MRRKMEVVTAEQGPAEGANLNGCRFKVVSINIKKSTPE